MPASGSGWNISSCSAAVGGDSRKASAVFVALVPSKKKVLSGSGLKRGRKTSTSLPFQGKPRPISVFSILNSVCFAPRASFATFPNTPFFQKEKKGPKPQQEKLKWTRLSAAVLSFFPSANMVSHYISPQHWVRRTRRHKKRARKSLFCNLISQRAKYSAAERGRQRNGRGRILPPPPFPPPFLEFCTQQVRKTAA